LTRGKQEKKKNDFSVRKKKIERESAEKVAQRVPTTSESQRAKSFAVKHQEETAQWLLWLSTTSALAQIKLLALDKS
jgi:hypothetical protein